MNMIRKMEKLDVLYRKILYHLDLNSRISYSELAKKLKQSKEVINYRIKKLIKQKKIVQFYTIINPHKFCFTAFKLYMNFQDINKETHDQMIDFLKKHKMVFWVASANGAFEMFLGIWARDYYDFNENFLTLFLNKFSKYISEKETTITVHNYQNNRKWFYEKGKERKITDTGGEPENIKLEKIDLNILKIIANNSRIGYLDIAKELNTTFQVVKYRIKKLEKLKVITHYKLGVDSKKYGREFVKTLLLLKNVTDKRRKELVSYTLSLEPTLNVVHCIGPWDLEFEMEIPNLEEYHNVMNQIREKFLDIVKSYKTAIIIHEEKVTFMPEVD